MGKEGSLEPSSAGPQGSISTARGQALEEGVGRVGVISHDFLGSGKQTLVIEGCQGGQLAADDPAGCTHHSLQFVSELLGSAAVPDADRERQGALYDGSVELDQYDLAQAKLF